MFYESVLAGGPGFEPGLTGSEPVVLPLNYPPARRRFEVQNLTSVPVTLY